MGVAGAQFIDSVDVESENASAGSRKCDCDWQPNTTQSNDGNFAVVTQATLFRLYQEMPS